MLGGWEERHGVRKISECAAEIISPRSAKIENYVPVTTVESSYVDIVPESTISLDFEFISLPVSFRLDQLIGWTDII